MNICIEKCSDKKNNAHDLDDNDVKENKAKIKAGRFVINCINVITFIEYHACYLSIHSSIHPSTHPSIDPYIYSLIYPSIHLSSIDRSIGVLNLFAGMGATTESEEK